MTLWNDLAARAYVPYSKHSEYCAVLGKSGVVYPGVRIENASFPLTIPAFKAAVFACISEGDEPDLCFIPKGMSLQGMPAHPIPVRYADTLSYPLASVAVGIHNLESEILRLRSHALVPHSDFPVVAAIETAGGLITGVNIEVNDWDAGLCAERIALAKAISFGFVPVEAIHIRAFRGSFISPCGACRQVLVEHMADQPVYLHHPDGTHSTHVCAHLLPIRFNGHTLRKD